MIYKLGYYSEIRRLILDDRGKDFREDAEGVIWFKDRLCVPNIQPIWELILKEAHETAYSIHPGSEKMYQDLKKKFSWYRMKRKSQSMWLCVIVVDESRQSIRGQLDCCNRCEFLSGNGMKSVCIS
jgi:cobalamin biosynthesis Mg chelatase CobN